MSVSIEVCKDIEEFQETVVAGMDGRHTAFAIAGLVSGGAVGFVGYWFLHLPTVAAAYAAMLGAAPAIVTGFLNKDGMGFIERIRRSLLLKREGIVYPVSTESPEYIAKLIKGNEKAIPKLDGNEKGSEEDMQKQLKNVIITAVISIVLFIVFVLVLLKLLK